MNAPTKIILDIKVDNAHYVTDTWFDIETFLVLRGVMVFQQMNETLIGVLLIHAFNIDLINSEKSNNINNISNYLIRKDGSDVMIDLILQNSKDIKHLIRKIKIEKFLDEN